ncbi:uncharacterized protein BJ171DRAFT_394768, partial [Polychytrium aggregatum]|uniref:uncharacterized protein n=1 Tax=Polychytrium aggregatum TaxID=110093 RepID=UPI0022FE75CF
PVPLTPPAPAPSPCLPLTPREQIQEWLQQVHDLSDLLEFYPAFTLLAQVMNHLCMHCESLVPPAPNGAEPSPYPDSGTAHNAYYDFWRCLNETWLSTLDQSRGYFMQADADFWLKLRTNVFEWGDFLEWYGLNDYELGFWESDVVSVINGIV